MQRRSVHHRARRSGSAALSRIAKGLTIRPSVVRATLLLGVLGCVGSVGAQTLEVTPASDVTFAFSGFEGGPFLPQTATSWTVANVDPDALNYTVASNQAWLSAAPNTGTLPGDGSQGVQATLNAAEAGNLAPAHYVATVTFTNISTGAGTTTRTVTLDVIPSSFSVSPSFVNVQAFGDGNDPSPAQVLLSNSGQSALNYALDWTPQSWFSVNKTGGTVPGGGSDTFTIDFSVTGLAPGTYNADIEVTNITNGAGDTYIQVSLTVLTSASGTVSLVPDTDMEVIGPEGNMPQSVQISTLQNGSASPVSWHAEASEAWVSVTPASGGLSGHDGAAGGTDEQDVSIRINVAANDLEAGSHTATVVFEDLDARVPLATRVVRVIVRPVLTLPTDLSGGTISLSPSGTSAGPGQWAFDFGEVVKVTVTVEEGAQFTGWAGDVSEDAAFDNPVAVVMDESKSVSPLLTSIERTLTLSVSGTGTGTITVTPEGTFEGNALVSRYANGAEVTVEAQADAGSAFAGWVGNVPPGSELDNPLSVVMDRDRVLTARFEPLVALKVDVQGDGTVSIDPELEAYALGTQVTLTAIPSESSVFVRWAGDSSSTAAVLTLTLNDDTEVQAVFADEGSVPNPSNAEGTTARLRVDVEGAGVVTPAGGTYDIGSSVTLVATPDVGWQFAGWDGDVSGSSLSIDVLIEKDLTIKALFVEGDGGTTASGVTSGGRGSSGGMCGAMGMIGLTMCFVGLVAIPRLRTRCR